MSGETTTAPDASPSHQVVQRSRYCGHDARWASISVVTPMVALSAGGIAAPAAANRKTSDALSNAAVPRANCVTSHAPTVASSVLPSAIPSDVRIEPAVVTLTTNALMKMAGT